MCSHKFSLYMNPLRLISRLTVFSRVGLNVMSKKALLTFMILVDVALKVNLSKHIILLNAEIVISIHNFITYFVCFTTKRKNSCNKIARAQKRVMHCKYRLCIFKALLRTNLALFVCRCWYFTALSRRIRRAGTVSTATPSSWRRSCGGITRTTSASSPPLPWISSTWVATRMGSSTNSPDTRLSCELLSNHYSHTCGRACCGKRISQTSVLHSGSNHSTLPLFKAMFSVYPLPSI